jgi:hypothetical protein
MLAAEVGRDKTSANPALDTANAQAATVPA